MSSNKNWLANIFLSITGILFLILLVSIIFSSGDNPRFIFYVVPVLIMCLSIITSILNHKYIKRGYIVFLSLLVFLCSVWLVLMRIGLIPGTVKNWWPLLGIFGGISILFAGRYHHKKWQFGFIIPAVILFIMGAWFLFFSHKIISIPFIDVVILCGPLLLIMCFVLLFVLFYYQKKNKAFVVKDDEESQFENDYYSPKKTD